MDRAKAQLFREMYGEEFSKFFLIPFGAPPFRCPYCQTETISTLWIGDPEYLIQGRPYAQWYRWCTNCLRGIYSPPGTYYVPEGQSYVRRGDEEALKGALPEGLRLILPRSAVTDRNKKKQ